MKHWLKNWNITLIGDDRGTPAERKWKELLFSAIKVVEEVQTGEQNLQQLISSLSNTFNTQDPGPGKASDGQNLDKKIKSIGHNIEKLKSNISLKMQQAMSADTAFERRALRKDEAEPDIASLIAFTHILKGDNQDHKNILDAFIQNRLSLINNNMYDCYNFFKIPSRNFHNEIQVLEDDKLILAAILEQKPTLLTEFHLITGDHPRHEIIRYLENDLQSKTQTSNNKILNLYRKIRHYITPPLHHNVSLLLDLVTRQIALLKISDSWTPDLWELLRNLHETIRIADEPSRALNIYTSLMSQSSRSGQSTAHQSNQHNSIQGDLEKIDDLFRQQDKVVRDRLEANLRNIVLSANTSSKSSGTSNITRIMALVDSLKQFNSISEAGTVFDELRQTLYDTFPVWIARKQSVPFILPCKEQSFDLVIIDEATQCKVDDAMSLMFRAQKILVVGDDKQTVLQKNSVIDDYLFKDHELDEHLRSTQARGFKGGGSHIFALVKAIKQASVMLDEHYRCPADIIEFSNRYVYDSGLNIMQWRLSDQAPAVTIDYSEQKKESSKKATSGKFKGIETEMVDRFFDFMVKTIKKIEKETGKRINVETDVAICYFLLKNEPYVKHIKDKYLKKLNRGEDILDGAGAALQGKERDYIFYLWDITRYNIGAFKQGDDADKRKGELNVLMSRPKIKAYHFLHRNFDQLEHSRTNITNYLWRANVRHERTLSQGPLTINPLKDTLLGALFDLTINTASTRNIKDVHYAIQNDILDFHDNIVVGESGRVVDLIAMTRGNTSNVIGLVDLSGFGSDASAGQSVVDYYFQLKRVSPSINPVFIFPHEIVNENSQSFQALIKKLETIDTK